MNSPLTKASSGSRLPPDKALVAFKGRKLSVRLFFLLITAVADDVVMFRLLAGMMVQAAWSLRLPSRRPRSERIVLADSGGGVGARVVEEEYGKANEEEEDEGRGSELADSRSGSGAQELRDEA